MLKKALASDEAYIYKEFFQHSEASKSGAIEFLFVRIINKSYDKLDIQVCYGKRRYRTTRAELPALKA